MRDLGEYDYVIAGAGAAGCVLANRLSADPDVSVLLLEAGGRDNWIWIHIPVGYLFCIGNPRTDWCYRTEPEPGLGGRSILYARGRVLGGSTSINAMIYMRGQARDYDDWAELTGDSSWNWDSVLPVFKRHQDHYAGGNHWHGAGGEWRVERQRLRWDLLDRFAEAAQQAGIDASADFNCGDNSGVGSFVVNQKRGVRWSASKAFLRPAQQRPNLTVMTGALIERVLLEGGEARGLVLRIKGEQCRVGARIETVLASGAIGSPGILERSGIGDGARLQALGIEVARDLPGVGANLQDHLQLRTVFKVQGIRTLNQQANSLIGKARMGLEYALFRRGPLTMAPSQLGLFARSSDAVDSPDLEFHVQPLSLDKFGEPLHSYPAFTASVCDLRPRSRGSVHIRGVEVAEPPIIAPRYLSDPADRIKAAKALRLARQIVAQPALAPYAPHETMPGPSAQTDEQLAEAAGRVGTTIFHPVGSCAMGRDDDAMAVVDSRLRVRGVGRLRVVDASVMPTITSGNTSSPTIMIAERGAEMIRADRRGG